MPSIKDKIINLDQRDYHMHSLNYSDGMNTIDEIVKFAGEIGLTEIAITDHSDAMMQSLAERYNVRTNGLRYCVKNWKNVHNNVSVIIGVEADILNEDGDISDTIQGLKSEYMNLSAHIDTYKGSKESINLAYKNAIERHHERIKCICHPCSNPNFGQEVDIESLIELANTYNIPLEINAKYLSVGKTNLEKLHILLEKADRIMINSDSHTLVDLRDTRAFVINYLTQHNYL